MKKHTITEYSKKWIITSKTGKMDVRYEIPKEVCKTLQDVENFIAQNKNKFEV